MADGSLNWYFALVAGVALLRVVELRLSRRRQVQLLARGGKKVTEPLYPLMIALHAWNVQVVVSTQPVVDWGPYRYVRHPNYSIVIVEMFALPLVHSAYLTALVFSLLNAAVLWQRIRCEEAALWARPEYVTKMGMKPRFLPVPSRGR